MDEIEITKIIAEKRKQIIDTENMIAPYEI